MLKTWVLIYAWKLKKYIYKKLWSSKREKTKKSFLLYILCIYSNFIYFYILVSKSLLGYWLGHDWAGISFNSTNWNRLLIIMVYVTFPAEYLSEHQIFFRKGQDFYARSYGLNFLIKKNEHSFLIAAILSKNTLESKK